MTWLASVLGRNRRGDPKRLLSELRSAGDDREAKKRLDDQILACGETATPHLARAILKFDLDRWVAQTGDYEKTFSHMRFVQHAAWLAGEIGEPFAEEQARAIFARFVDGRTGGDAQAELWGGLWSDITQTLQKLGHIRIV